MLGKILQGSIQFWIRITGKKLALAEHPWLEGPMSKLAIVGDRFYETFAKEEGLEIRRSETGGLVGDFGVLLEDGSPMAQQMNPRVAEFYEHTASYKLEVWSQWFSFFSFFAKILIRTVSRKMEQMNIPLEALETSHGMSSDVIQLCKGEEVKYTCWLRKSVKTGRIVYAGFYTHCQVDPNLPDLVKVVFPLPKGNVTVLLKAQVQEDGSMKLLSDGKRIGESGYYRLQAAGEGFVRAKFIPLKEVIHVYEDPFGVMRTDHIFRFMGMKLLELHYKIMPPATPHA